jgi:hypothetical protein
MHQEVIVTDQAGKQTRASAISAAREQGDTGSGELPKGADFGW